MGDALPPPDAPTSGPPRTQRSPWGPGAGRILLGGLLVVVGLLWLLGTLLNLDLGQLAWPFFVIVPGVGLFLLALMLSTRGGVGLAVAGSMVTMTGLLLLYQNATGHWESWAYAWALIAPGSVGVGMILYGLLTDQPDLIRPGIGSASAGIVIFFAGAVFFEVILGISGRQFGRIGGAALSALLIGFGVVLLVANAFAGRRTVK